MNYCPKCFNPSLKMNKKGICYLTINDKHLDNGRFMYDLNSEGPDVIKKNLEKKISEFFSWYSKFNAVEPITKVHFTSNNFSCSQGCPQSPARNTVVDILVSKKSLMDLIDKYAKKYGMVVNIDDEEEL